MARRKIAYLTPLYFDEGSYLGGGERYPLNLARGVVAASGGAYTVELISFGDRSRNVELAPGVSLRVLTASRTPRNALDVLSWELPDALRDADIVHIHQAFTRCSEMGLLISKLQRKPVCVTDHGGVTSSLGAEIGHLSLCDRIIAQSDFAASLLTGAGAPILVIKGGVDGEHFCPPVNKPKREGVLYVGRLLPHKGVDVLVRALPHDLPLTVCGRPYHEAYYNLLRELARGKRVRFITNADDQMIRKLYSDACVSVLPSVYRDQFNGSHRAPELMGLTLLEAMACGTPVICSRVGGMPEFIEHGHSGFVFDDPSELTGYLQRLATDPALVNCMGNEARNQIETRFDLRVVGVRLKAVYDELLESHARQERAA
jgi:glycosyltransferase involved in cell wall biosynthesis